MLRCTGAAVIGRWRCLQSPVNVIPLVQKGLPRESVDTRVRILWRVVCRHCLSDPGREGESSPVSRVASTGSALIGQYL